MRSKLKIILSLVLIVITSASSMSKTGDLLSDEFARRRAVFLNELRNLNACAILHTSTEFVRNPAVEYPYRQDSDFYYLTGWTQRDGILVFTPAIDTEKQNEISFFVTERSPKTEVWTGPTLGIEEASQLPGIDRAQSYDEFYDELQNLVADYERLVISYGNNGRFKSEFEAKLDDLRQRPGVIQVASSLLKSQRLIKSDLEIESMEKAIAITRESLLEVLPMIPTFSYEYEAQAALEYGFNRRGAERLAFPSIIGAGKNATYLHYRGHHGQLAVGDLLLMDIGAEWNYYAADITRTVPISGTFGPEQKAIYQLVLDAQAAAIQTIKPGALWNEPHNKAVEILTAGLVELGLLEGDVTELIQSKSYGKYFMHGISHWLGLDVHDVGDRRNADGQYRRFQSGMVLTVEPGLYIREAQDVDPRWWNIGVRIEDDVLVTNKGNRVLSKSIPKTIPEIEALMQP